MNRAASSTAAGAEPVRDRGGASGAAEDGYPFCGAGIPGQFVPCPRPSQAHAPVHVYRITATLQDNNAANGGNGGPLSVGDHSFTFEAQNQ